MSRLVLLLAFASASAFGAGPETPQERPQTRVGIYFDFEGDASDLSIQEMEQEAAKIFAPAGIQLLWRNVNSNAGTEPFSDVMVLRFRGDCRARSGVPPPARRSEHSQLPALAMVV